MIFPSELDSITQFGEDSMKKHYILATRSVYTGKELLAEAAIVSGHVDYSVAMSKASKLERSAIHGRGAFALIESADDLEKGKCYPELLEKWKAEKYERDAISTMKSVIDPAWKGGAPETDETIAWWLQELGLSLEQLRETYGEKAQAELDAARAQKLQDAEQRAQRSATKAQLSQERREEITFAFPAVRGVQAGRAYYAAQIPYPILVKLFTFDDEDVVPADMRAQRVLSEKRAKDIADYVSENPNDYVLPAITASVSAEMSFEPVAVGGAADRVGVLHVPLGATLLINDGQHRRRGIEHALRQRPSLRDETIVVTIFYDQGLRRSQQMFADINGKQVKPSSAINSLYDRRSPFNAWALSVLELLPEIRKRIDFENGSVGAKSYKLWSVVAFKKFLSCLTGVNDKNILEVGGLRLREIESFVVRFFAECKENIPQWAAMIYQQLSAFEVRENLVIGHAVWLEALGLFGRHALLYGSMPSKDGLVAPEFAMWVRMQSLKQIDPQKGSEMWEGRCVVLGKMLKTSTGVKATAARLLKEANIPLPKDMQLLDELVESKG